MPNLIKVAAIQMRSVDGDVEASLRKAETLVEEAAGACAQLVILPEGFNTGY